MVVLLKHLAGHWGCFHTYLLKKLRTPWSNTFPQQQDSKGGRSSRRPCDETTAADGYEVKAYGLIWGNLLS